jgi:hypothetical protein
MTHTSSRSTRSDTPASPRVCVSAYTRSAGGPEHDVQLSTGEEHGRP